MEALVIHCPQCWRSYTITAYLMPSNLLYSLPSLNFSESPLGLNAESSLHYKFAVLSDELLTANMLHTSQEPAALLWISKNFAGKALAMWSEGLAVAKLLRPQWSATA